jgi:predicted DNA binding CopG/RHH family protein
MDYNQEILLSRWLAAMAAISKSTYFYQQVKSAETQCTNAATAISAVAARITQAIADAVSGRASAALGATAITLANAEFDLINAQIDLAVTALSTGSGIINTIPVGGGSSEYMGQAASDVGAGHGFLASGQAYLQEASADNANAAQYFNAAATELRAASEKVSEAISSLRLVATRMQVSQGGLNYERWGRTELERVKNDLRNYGGLPTQKRFPQS